MTKKENPNDPTFDAYQRRALRWALRADAVKLAIEFSGRLPDKQRTTDRVLRDAKAIEKFVKEAI